MFTLRRWLAVPLLVATVLSSQAAVVQAGGIDEAVERLAGQVARYLKTARDEDRLGIRGFDMPVRPSPTSTGRLLERRLAQRLKDDHGIEIVRTANTMIAGQVSVPAAIGPERPLSVRLTVNLMDGAGNHFGDFSASVEVDDTTDVANLLGATFDAVSRDEAAPVPAPAAPPLEARRAVLAQSIESPRFDLRGTSVFPRPESPFGLELLVSSDGGKTFVPAPVEDDSGSAYSEIGPDQIYRVRIHNLSQHDVAVEVMVDGLNALEFSEVPDVRSLGVWVIPAGRIGVIPGWLRDIRTVSEFRAAGIPDDLAADNIGPNRMQVGTVTAVFFAAWAAGERKPDVEPVGQRGAPRGTLAGLTGPEVPAPRFVRNVGVTPLASVSVRYDNPSLADPPKVRTASRMRTGSRILQAVSRRHLVSYSPGSDTAQQGLERLKAAVAGRQTAFQLLPFEQRPIERRADGHIPVDRAGEIVAAAIAAQLHAWGFRVTVAWDDLPDELQEQLRNEPAIDMKQADMVAVFSGTVGFEVDHQRQAAGRDRTTARIELSVTVEARTPQAQRIVYEHTLRDRESIEASGLAGRSDRSKQAAAAVLQRIVGRILSDPKLEAGLLDTLPSRERSEPPVDPEPDEASQ